MDKIIKYDNDIICPYIDLQTPVGFFLGNIKLILKFISKSKELRIDMGTLMNKVGGLRLLDIKSC